MGLWFWFDADLRSHYVAVTVAVILYQRSLAHLIFLFAAFQTGSSRRGWKDHSLSLRRLGLTLHQEKPPSSYFQERCLITDSKRPTNLMQANPSFSWTPSSYPCTAIIITNLVQVWPFGRLAPGGLTRRRITDKLATIITTSAELLLSLRPVRL